MIALYLVIGILLTVLAFERSRFGPVFLIIVVLGMLKAAETKGVFKKE